MKKAVVVAIGISSVVAIILVLPAIQAVRIESRIRGQVKTLNHTLGQNISIKIKRYDRGWFRSNMRISCAIGSDEQNSWTIPIDVIHGPFPIAEIIKGQMPLRFFDAQLESHFTPSIPDTVVQKALAQIEKPLFNLSATFSANDSVRMTITSPAVSSAGKDFQWKGASVSLVSREEPKDIKIDLGLAGFWLRNVERNLKLKAGEVKWSFEASNSYASIESDLNINGFYREYEGAIIEIKKLKTKIESSRGDHELHYGNSSASIRKLKVKVPDWGVDWELNKFLLHNGSNLIKSKYEVTTQGRAQELVTPDMIVGPLGYSLTIRELEPAAFFRAMSGLKSQPQTESSAKDQSSKKNQTRLFKFVQSVLSKGSPRIEGLVNIKDGARRGKIGIHLIIDGGRATEIESLRELPDAATGNLNLRFSAGLFEELWKLGIGVVATATESVLRGDPAKIENETQLYISKLIKSKLLVQKENLYTSRFYLNQGTITVNRLPFDVLRILADVMAQDPKEITVNYGKLGVRGGLQLDDIRGPLATLTKDIKSCVQKEIDDGRGHPRGVVHVKWKISDTGQSQSPTISYTTVVNPTLEACVVSLFSDLKFPSAKQTSRAVLVIGFSVPDIARPRRGLKFGTLHHYKNPFPAGTSYTVGRISEKR